MKNKQAKKRLITALFFIATAASITLPAVFLHFSFSGKLNQTNKVDEELYNADNSALARNTSESLSEYDRMKLISSLWDSERKEIEPGPDDMSKPDAIARARNIFKKFYDEECYPVNFDSNYNDWYSWDAKYYKATDTSFHTYCAYYWEITFYKYDADEYHKILLTENGNLLAIKNNMEANYKKHNIYYYLLEKNFISNPYFYSDLGLIDINKSSYFTANNKTAPDNLYEGFTLEEANESKKCYIVLNNSFYTTAKALENYSPDDMPKGSMILCIYYQYNDKEFTMNIVPWEGE